MLVHVTLVPQLHAYEFKSRLATESAHAQNSPHIKYSCFTSGPILFLYTLIILL